MKITFCFCLSAMWICVSVMRSWYCCWSRSCSCNRVCQSSIACSFS